MIVRFYLILTVFSIILNSCENAPKKVARIDSGGTLDLKKLPQPNYNYTIEPPDNWNMIDTIMQGLKVRFIIPSTSLANENPTANVIIAFMENGNINDFRNRNMNYLKSSMEGITLLEEGDIDIQNNNAKWFTYTKEQNGITRDMINYIIPIDGFAYMITCGTNKGSISKYRLTFDTLAKSFKG